MARARFLAVSLVFAALAIFHAGCGDQVKPNPDAAGGGDAPDVRVVNQGANQAKRPFLNKKKQIPAGLEWNTNVVSKNGGPFSFRLDSQGPFSVTIVTENGYQAMKNNDQKSFKKSDMLLTIDSKTNTYENKVHVPPGASWFIIGNQAKTGVEFHLQCFEP